MSEEIKNIIKFLANLSESQKVIFETQTEIRYNGIGVNEGLDKIERIAGDNVNVIDDLISKIKEDNE